MQSNVGDKHTHHQYTGQPQAGPPMQDPRRTTHVGPTQDPRRTHAGPTQDHPRRTHAGPTQDHPRRTPCLFTFIVMTFLSTILHYFNNFFVLCDFTSF